MAGYVFYDTETTGTLTAFDQILQFGAIRTDDKFNELDRLDIRCRLMPHIVPAPKALEVTGVTPDMLIDPGLPSHYEMMGAIRATLDDWSPAVFIGFNSLSFDEPLLRQAFDQTLQPIYLTNTGGNGSRCLPSARTRIANIRQGEFLENPVYGGEISSEKRLNWRPQEPGPFYSFTTFGLLLSSSCRRILIVFLRSIPYVCLLSNKYACFLNKKRCPNE